jgi:hypothetical protein
MSDKLRVEELSSNIFQQCIVQTHFAFLQTQSQGHPLKQNISQFCDRFSNYLPLQAFSSTVAEMSE